MQALTPAEQFVLLDPMGAEAKEAVKTTLLSLVARGALRIDTISERGFFGAKTKSVLSETGNSIDAGPHETALLRVIGGAGVGGGATLDKVALAARSAFGDGLRKFVTDYIHPSLMRRGLIAESTRKVAIFFTRKVKQLTPAGEMEKQRILALIERARDLPNLLKTNPAAAAAIVLAAGGVLLLLPELKEFYGQLAAVRPHSATGDYSHDHGSSTSSGDSGSGADLNLGSFDTTSLAALDSDAFASFDSSFDSSFSSSGGSDSSDSGGGGGGDSGGGGD